MHHSHYHISVLPAPKKVLCTQFPRRSHCGHTPLGGVLPPPLQQPWRPAVAMAPSGKILGKKIWEEIFFGGGYPPSPLLQHPLAACGRNGPFGATSEHA